MLNHSQPCVCSRLILKSELGSKGKSSSCFPYYDFDAHSTPKTKFWQPAKRHLAEETSFLEFWIYSSLDLAIQGSKPGLLFLSPDDPQGMLILKLGSSHLPGLMSTIGNLSSVHTPFSKNMTSFWDTPNPIP